MRFKFSAIPLAALAALAVAACGSSSPTTLTRAELVAHADPICKQVALERSAANSALSKVSSSTAKTLEVLAHVAPGISTYEHDAVERLATLKAPSTLSREWQEMLTGIRQLANDTTQLGIDARAKNDKSVHSIDTSGRELQQRLAVIANRDGFAYCGKTS